ncbi:hypothetical protein AB4099_09785 [Bosea sp. 2KB_26]|uniref:hypothetical protein n=1 Tax=Bosea sp. 2KB_26 TaxID=3237475 RepID=UPI003F8E6801
MTESGLSGVISRIGGYAAHHDRRAALANTVALVVASNQPFYPLYIYWAVSQTIWPALASFLSTPFFLAVPALMRRSPVLGRTMLVLAGIGNTLLCQAVFGAASGVAVFLFPCIALAILLFRRTERAIAFGLAAVAFATYLAPSGIFGAPAHVYGFEEYAAFRRLNFLSAATLTALIALLFANAFDDANAQPAETEEPHQT